MLITDQRGKARPPAPPDDRRLRAHPARPAARSARKRRSDPAPGHDRQLRACTARPAAASTPDRGSCPTPLLMIAGRAHPRLVRLPRAHENADHGQDGSIGTPERGGDRADVTRRSPPLPRGAGSTQDVGPDGRTAAPPRPDVRRKPDRSRRERRAERHLTCERDHGANRPARPPPPEQPFVAAPDPIVSAGATSPHDPGRKPLASVATGSRNDHERPWAPRTPASPAGPIPFGLPAARSPSDS